MKKPRFGGAFSFPAGSAHAEGFLVEQPQRHALPAQIAAQAVGQPCGPQNQTLGQRPSALFSTPSCAACGLPCSSL